MRKTLIIVIFFLFILFQSTITIIFPQIEKFFFLPSLPIILLAYVALFAGPEKGTTIGFFIGFVEDSLSTGLMGLNSLTKTLLGFILGISGRKFVITNKILQFIAVIFLTFANDLGLEILKLILGAGSVNTFEALMHFIAFKILPGSIMNGFIAILLFPLFKHWNLVTIEGDSD